MSAFLGREEVSTLLMESTSASYISDVPYARPPHLFVNTGSSGFRDVAADLGSGFAQPKVGRGLAYGDFDRDGDLDLLLTTNNGPAYLYENDGHTGNNSIRFHLVGTKSNRDGIGAVVRIFYDGQSQSRMVRGGSSYLSQSELPVTFGLGKRPAIERVQIEWPSGSREEFKKLDAGRSYQVTAGKGITTRAGF